MALEGYLYVGSSLSSLCGFNIFGGRALLSMGACWLFPQRVLVVIPFIVDVQMRRLVPSPGVLGSGGSGMPPGYEMGLEAAHNHSWSLGSLRWGL